MARGSSNINEKTMSAKFMSAVLAALNESSVVAESDWNSTEAPPNKPIDLPEDSLQTGEALGSENRFAVTVSSCMAKIRSSTLGE
jgi:hypothetical protein